LLLTSSLDYDVTLRRVARLPIPRQADWCMAYVPQGGEALTARLAIAHANASDEAALRAVWHRQPFRLPDHHPLLEVMRTCEAVAVPHCSADIIESLAGSAEATQALARVGARSLAVLPLLAHDQCIGGLMLVATRASRRPYDQAAIEPLSQLAAVAAHAIYNARLFSEAKLALRLRDEVIVAASSDLMSLIDNVRRRTDSLRRRQETAPASGPPPGVSAVAAIDELADEMEHLVAELRLVADTSKSR
jgi:GAF domain-containing protein